MEMDTIAALRELPGGFRPCEPCTDHGNIHVLFLFYAREPGGGWILSCRFGGSAGGVGEGGTKKFPNSHKGFPALVTQGPKKVLAWLLENDILVVRRS